MHFKTEIPVFCTGFNHDHNQASDESGLMCVDVSLAQQQFRDESDVNNIVKRFLVTGDLPSNPAMPQYADFEAVNDYHSALNVVRSAEQAFYSLDPKVRARFDNDAGLLLEFLSDEKNEAEAIKLGLIRGPENLGPIPQELDQKPSDSAAGVPVGA